MSQTRVLLLGYYGKANFGDDVLLKVTYGLLKKALPHASLSVVVDGDGGNYIPAMLGEVTVLSPGRHGVFDCIVHGGGGVFFDFRRQGFIRRILERMARIFGFRSFLALERMARRMTNKSRTSAQRRLGLGIGVGTFAPGSPKLWQSLPALSDFDALWVRDAQSVEHLKRFQSIMHAEIIRGSDLAFLTEHWMPPIAQKPQSARPRLGVVLRDWRGTDIKQLREMLALLAKEYAITGFVFECVSDPEMQALLSSYALHLWQPDTVNMDAFVAALSAQDVLLASRAHGVICGACVGVPSVIVNIEPKLEQVHAMLPNTTILVASDAPQDWAGALQKVRVIPRDVIAADVARNRAASEAALLKMEPWLQ